MEIIILGCGVIGLTTALRLCEEGHRVTIRTWKLPPYTTSDKAAAFWSPYRISEDEQTFSWIGETYLTLRELSRVPGSGVSMIRLDKYLKDTGDISDAWWLKAIPDSGYAAVPPDQLPKGYKNGWRTEVPLMETPRYLPFLLDRLKQYGGQVISGEQITDVSPYLGGEDLVVNCTGMGSRALMQDESLQPVRGQIAVIRTSQVRDILVDADEPIYLVPREDGCIVGGTYERNEWEEHPEPATIETILGRAPALFPGLDTSDILRTYAGLRPYRPTVRVEADPTHPRLLHNYGHGGAGFTLSWGTAGSIVQLVRRQGARQIPKP
jgi:D-amino-acid oxidase